MIRRVVATTTVALLVSAVAVTVAGAAVVPVGLAGTVSCGAPATGTGTANPPYTMSAGIGPRTVKSTITLTCTGTSFNSLAAPAAAKVVSTATSPDSSMTCAGLLSPGETTVTTKSTVTWTVPGVTVKPTQVVFTTRQSGVPSMGSTTPGPTGTSTVTGSYAGSHALESLVVTDSISTLTALCSGAGLKAFHFGAGSSFAITGGSIPASARYSSPQYDASTIRQYPGLLYSNAVDYTGTLIPLRLDVYAPPTTAPLKRPTVVLIHGGAFVGGSRGDMVGVAQAWVVRGYNAVSIDYRLDQSLYQDSSPPKQVAAATNATIDAEAAVRWLKGNAGKYGIDTTRIVAVGYSAGGGIALGMSASPDFARTAPYASYSSKIQAAVSTGAYLTPALDLGTLTITSPTLAPILMFHYETDVASNTGPYAFRTCTAYRTAGSTCEYVSQPGEGHTTDLTPGSLWWANEIGPFVWSHLKITG